MKRISDRQRIRLKEYSVVRKIYLNEHGLCAKCGGKASDIHHKRGKLGALLTRTEHFVSVCRDCHHWIHDHPKESRELGLLCEKGQWNSQS